MTRFNVFLLSGSALLIGLSMAAGAQAGAAKADLALATLDGPGASVGQVVLTDSPSGAVFAYDLKGLPPGPHGFHIHAGGSCAPGPAKDGKVIPAGAAGGHYDPAAAAKHLGPMGEGHMGDLPLITVGADGVAKGQVAAPHIAAVSALVGHALMLHAGGDNYSDDPAPLGGGGARLVCGIIR